MKITRAFLSNKNLTTLVSLLIAIYAGLAAPALPNSVIMFFDQWYGKILFIFLIGYVASRNVQIALMIAVLFFVILHLAAKLGLEKFQNREYFEEEKKTKNLGEDLKKEVCKMVKTKKEVDMKMVIKDFVEKNSKELIEKLGINEEVLKKTLDEIRKYQTLEELCKSSVDKKEKFENEEEGFENEEEGFKNKVNEDDNEVEESFISANFNVEPIDYSEMGAGAPVDF